MLVTIYFLDQNKNRIAQIGDSNMEYGKFADLMDQTSHTWAYAAKRAFQWAASETLKPISMELDGSKVGLPFNVELVFTKEV